MLGDPSSEQMKGIIPRTFNHILSNVGSADEKNTQYLISCSYLEIYNEEIHDLLSKDLKQKMEMKESPEKGVYIKDLSTQIVKSIDEMEKYMNLGNNSRTVGETLMNKESSRSHSIFTLYVEQSVTDEQVSRVCRPSRRPLLSSPLSSSPGALYLYIYLCLYIEVWKAY